MEITTLRLMNAAGFIKGPGPEFDDLLRSAATEVVVGSVTMERRPGSTGQNFIVLPDGTSANSIQLKNFGIEGTETFIDDMVERTHKAGKLFRLSVSIDSLHDIGPLVRFARRHKVDTLELNLACPNRYAAGVQQAVFALNIELTSQALHIALAEIGPKMRLVVKLAPYEDKVFAESMARTIGKVLTPRHGVLLSNTKGGFQPLDEKGRPLLRAISPDGTEVNAGGMAGTRLRDLVISNIKTFRPILPRDIGLEYVGGISAAEHVLAGKDAGADAFQVGTAYFVNGDAGIFSDIAIGLTSP